MEASPIDIQGFRQTLGQFATGVTIVTACAENGEPVGITANSFNSVSMDPPLILWSLAKDAMSLSVFRDAGVFNVHVLAADQQDLSDRFASRGADKFADTPYSSGVNEAPLLGDCAATFQCRTMHQYDGGDHVIFVGEVLACERSDKPPLVYHGGRYAAALPKVSDKGQTPVDLEAGSFTSDFFIYLLSRAHNQFSGALLKPDAHLGLPRAATYVVSILCQEEGDLKAEDIAGRLAVTGHAPTEEVFERLMDRGLISIDAELYSVTDQGREFHIALLARSLDVESHALADFSQEEIALFKDMLRRLIEKTDTGLSTLWG